MGRSLAIARLRSAVEAGRIEWQRHALERIAERGVSQAAVKCVLLKGERIEDYPDAYPMPAALFVGMSGERVLHVVAAYDLAASTAYVITAYVPSLEHFEPDLRTRRRR
jgi:hypothetical protein